VAENTYKKYRVTWRHEVYFKAKTDIEARGTWREIDKRLSGDANLNEFVEEVSFECVDDGYRDIP